MKRSHLRIAPLALLLGLSACDDLLTETPESFLSPDNFYRSARDAEAAIAGVYPPLNSLWDGSGITQLNLVADDASTNNPNAQSTTGVDEADHVDFDAEVGFSGALWDTFFRVIYRTNLVTDRVPGIDMATERRSQIVAEAKFVRALSYFYLVRFFGDVPLFTSEAETKGDAPRTPKEQVFQQIIKDATEAAAALPASWSGTNVGRPTKGSALTLLADVHLWRREWQKAADNAKAVIDLGVHSLQSNYLAAFSPGTQNGPENVFSIQVNGLTDETGSNYVYRFYPRTLAIGQGGGWSDVEVNQKFADSYLVGDYRKDVSIKTVQLNAQGRPVTITPHINKFRPSQAIQISAGDVNYFIYRYADVLLIHAEALNELGRTAEAVAQLNLIRARARRGTGAETRAEPHNYGTQAGEPLTQGAVREAIFMERRWELAFESDRWFDLVRRGPDYLVSELRNNDPAATEVDPGDVLMPIPADEIQLNPNLTQNPGY